jgi:hypothetical protein
MRAVISGIILVILSMTPLTVQASVVVDFSQVSTTVDLINEGPLLLGNVTFSYDDQGRPDMFAAVDAAGVIGSTGGLLILELETPATDLAVTFSVLDIREPLGGVLADALLILLDLEGNVVAEVSAEADYVPWDDTDPSLGGYAFGTLVYSGLPFDIATLLFPYDDPLNDPASAIFLDPAAQVFTVDSVTLQAVPEPTLWVAWAIGLAVCGCRHIRWRGHPRP